MNRDHCIVYDPESIPNHQVIDNRSIQVVFINNIPYVNVTEKLSETVFKVCGSLVMFIIEFAKSARTKLEFYPQPYATSMVLGPMFMKEYDIVLAPWSLGMLKHYKEKYFDTLGIEFGNSDFIGQYLVTSIAAKVIYGSAPIMQYLSCFSAEIWALISASIIILSLISVKNHNLFSILKMIYNYSVFAISGTFDSSLISVSPYLPLAIWFASVLVLSNCFQAYFFDLLMNEPDVYLFDSFEKIAFESKLKIIMREENTMNQFILNDSSPMSILLKNRSITYDDYDTENIPDIVSSGLKNGSVAFVHDEVTLHTVLKMMIKEKNLSIDSILITSNDSVPEPYFIFFNKDMKNKPWAIESLNKMIRMCRESGLYNFWKENILDNLGNQFRDTRFYEKKVDQVVYYSDLKKEQIFDVLMFLGLKLSISIALFIVEIIYFTIKYQQAQLFERTRHY